MNASRPLWLAVRLQRTFDLMMGLQSPQGQTSPTGWWFRETRLWGQKRALHQNCYEERSTVIKTEEESI